MGYTDQAIQNKFQVGWRSRRRQRFIELRGACAECGCKRSLHIARRNYSRPRGKLQWSVSKRRLKDQLRYCVVLCDKHFRERLYSGLSQKRTGKRYNPTKLKPKDVREIRKLSKTRMTLRAIGARYKVSHTTINDIALGKTWRDVK